MENELDGFFCKHGRVRSARRACPDCSGEIRQVIEAQRVTLIQPAQRVLLFDGGENGGETKTALSQLRP